ncbi:MAG: hypothetical protein CVV07_02150 [Gammaproteobacteria bacterium HGW-Gammaproteobacteria-11]|nr:MAG: hypothetical protein CVV07_02150 [Gammaproteobacteria bacterium HGW-Gammaproteobacteria-11]
MLFKFSRWRGGGASNFFNKIAGGVSSFFLFFQPNKKRILKRQAKVRLQEIHRNDFSRDGLAIDKIPFEACYFLKSANGAPEKLEKRLAVYSVFFGPTPNSTFRRTEVRVDIDHYFISNNRDVLEIAESSGWIPVFFDIEISENVILSAHQAKIAKAMPHKFPFLNAYSFLLYIDDKLQFDLAMLKIAVQDLESSGAALAIRKHPFLQDNILEEFGEAMLQRRYRSQRGQIVEYITGEVGSGYRLNPGQLYATGVILRNMRHTEIQNINECWYSHILRCGIECQIAFDFVAQRYNNVNILPQEIA